MNVINNEILGNLLKDKGELEEKVGKLAKELENKYNGTKIENIIFFTDRTKASLKVIIKDKECFKI